MQNACCCNRKGSKTSPRERASPSHRLQKGKDCRRATFATPSSHLHRCGNGCCLGVSLSKRHRIPIFSFPVDPLAPYGPVVLFQLHRFRCVHARRSHSTGLCVNHGVIHRFDTKTTNSIVEAKFSVSAKKKAKKKKAEQCLTSSASHMIMMDVNRGETTTNLLLLLHVMSLRRSPGATKMGGNKTVPTFRNPFFPLGEVVIALVRFQLHHTLALCRAIGIFETFHIQILLQVSCKHHR